MVPYRHSVTLISPFGIALYCTLLYTILQSKPVLCRRCERLGGTCMVLQIKPRTHVLLMADHADEYSPHPQTRARSYYKTGKIVDSLFFFFFARFVPATGAQSKEGWTACVSTGALGDNYAWNEL